MSSSIEDPVIREKVRKLLQYTEEDHLNHLLSQLIKETGEPLHKLLNTMWELRRESMKIGHLSA